MPLLATQILWINLLTDTAPALALGVDPPPDDVMGRPAARPDRPRDRPRDVGGIVWVGLVMADRDAGRAGPAPGGRLPRRLRRHRRGADDGVHHAGARPAVQLLQRPLGPHERLPPTVHKPVAVGRDRALGRAPGRASCSCRCSTTAFGTVAAGARRLADLHRPRELRALGRRGQEAARAPAASTGSRRRSRPGPTTGPRAVTADASSVSRALDCPGRDASFRSMPRVWTSRWSGRAGRG